MQVRLTDTLATALLFLCLLSSCVPGQVTSAQASNPPPPAPVPVVMVHGFSSNSTAWSTYLGTQGFLAQAGIPGFAVGDGQFPGAMNTGRIENPTGRTNTIDENAHILGDYIAAVKAATGASQVDLLAHSMGGLISRYYIAQVMEERDVRQLIMLGSPMAGTECANLPASLGLYLPAVLEIRPSYVRGIFNPLVNDRRGVPFSALAGIPIKETFQSPCTGVPTDLAVSQASVVGIPVELVEMPVLHTSLNTSEEVFNQFVLPRLLSPPVVEEHAPAAENPELQFTRIFNGQVPAGGQTQVTVQVDAGVSVASFALYDTTRSLGVTVRGVSGNEIPLSAEANGLVIVEDPATLFYLGYGFQNPKPGAWQVMLHATDETPASGAEFALTAHFEGGPKLEAEAIPVLPRPGEVVELSARLEIDEQPLVIETAQAIIRDPQGETTAMDLSLSGGEAGGSWKPLAPGLYGIDLQVQGRSVDGTLIERTAFFSIQAQPAPAGPDRLTLLVLAVAGPLLLAVGLPVIIWRRWKSREISQR
jgi:pimeloyl-ACP methyl ester carboxylesterase